MGMFQDNNVDKYHDRLARMCPVKNAIMSLVNSVNKFQKELKKRFAIASPDKYVTVSLVSSARMFPSSNVTLSQELFQGKSVPMFQDKNAEMFQNSNVTMFQGSNVGMFLVSSARMSPDRSVRMSHANNVKMFQG